VLTEMAKKEAVSEANLPMWLAVRLTSSRPKLSPLFEGSVARMMPIDALLAAHLELFGVIYRGVEHHVDKLIRDVEYHQEHGKLLRAQADTTADAKVMRDGLLLAAKHAECAEYLLTILVLSRWRLWNRVRRFVLSSGSECECKQLLKTGAP
jgi:hypothetical protein